MSKYSILYFAAHKILILLRGSHVELKSTPADECRKVYLHYVAETKRLGVTMK